MCLHVQICMCIYMYIHVCVHVHVCVCIRNSTRPMVATGVFMAGVSAIPHCDKVVSPATVHLHISTRIKADVHMYAVCANYLQTGSSGHTSHAGHHKSPHQGAVQRLQQIIKEAMHRLQLFLNDHNHVMTCCTQSMVCHTQPHAVHAHVNICTFVHTHVHTQVYICVLVSDIYMCTFV